MAFVPNQFLAHMKSRGGPAKTNRYQTVIPIPKIIGKEVQENSILSKILDFANNPSATVTGFVSDALTKDNRDKNKDSLPELSRFLALQCESTNFPSKSLNVVAAKTYGPVFKIPTAVEYGNFSMTFLCTNDFYERKLFERWIEVIMPLTTNDFRFPKGDSPENSYYSEIRVIQYDDFVQQVYAIKLRDAFPVSINDQVVSWTDDNFHRLTVNFAYQNYTTIYEGKFDTEAITGAVLSNPGGAFNTLKTAIGSLANPIGSGGILDPATNFSGYGVFR